MLNKNLKALRMDMMMNKADFCKTIGVSSKTLSRWESGERMPSLCHLKRIVDTYHIEDVYAFMYGARMKPLTQIPKLVWVY